VNYQAPQQPASDRSGGWSRVIAIGGLWTAIASYVCPIGLSGQAEVSKVFQIGGGSPAEPFGEVSAVFHDPSTGRVFIADAMARTISVIDESGGLLISFGRDGSGPGEFSSAPLGITVLNGHLIVADQSYIQRFTLDGEYVDRVDFRAENRVSVITGIHAGPDFLLVSTREVEHPDQIYGLYRVQNHEAVLLERLPVLLTPDLTKGERQHWGLAGGRLLIGQPGRPSVVLSPVDGGEEATVAVRGSGRTFSSNDVGSLRAQLDEQCGASSIASRCRTAADEYLAAAKEKRGPVPPVGALLGAQDGTWVVALADGPGDLFSRTYQELEMFDVAGTSSGRIRLAEPLEPMFFSGGVVWGVVYGAYDEPFVTGYRLRAR